MGSVSVSVASTPPPVVGVTVNVEPVAGTVLVRLPGTDRFVPLSSLASIPVGSTVDVTAGTVRLTQARPEGTRESAEFYEGVFTILQSRAAEAVAVLRLEGGDFSECGGTSAFFAEKPKRKLWGAGKGKFRTRGRFSAATVRGTTWYTADACDGTLTRVTEGSVTVTDFVRGVDVVVAAGQSYLATPARPRARRARLHDHRHARPRHAARYAPQRRRLRRRRQRPAARPRRRRPAAGRRGQGRAARRRAGATSSPAAPGTTASTAAATSTSSTAAAAPTGSRAAPGTTSSPAGPVATTSRAAVAATGSTAAAATTS